MKYKLEDICLKITDGSHYSPKQQKSGYPMLSVKDMLEYGFSYSSCKCISKEDYLKMVEGDCVPQKNDILVAKDGSFLKHIFICNETKEEAILSSIAIFRPDTKIVIPDFLCYLLKSPKIFNYISKNCVSGSALPRIVLKDFKQVEVEVPSIVEQKKIISILLAIDKKIKLNLSINDNLEQQALTIFDDMFPHCFDGKSTIGDIITPKRGKVLLSKNAVLGDVPVVAGGLEPATYHNISNTKPPVLVISASGANAGYVSLWTIPIWSSDSSYIDSSMTDDVYFWYVLLKKRQKEIFDAQTGSAQPHIYPQHIASMPIFEISKSEISSYTTLVTPMFEKIGKNKTENKRLSCLRDTLLPKLMSGEIDVSSIEL